MLNSNKIQNYPIQAAHRIDLGALYQCLRVLQIPFTVLFIFNRAVRDRKDIDQEPRIFILHFTGLRLNGLLPIVSTVAFHYFLLSLYNYYLSSSYCF